MVLLYRNAFFIEPEAPAPRPQVQLLDFYSPTPLAAGVPALEAFPDAGPWETEIVRQSPSGNWYYRMREKGKTQNETAYFRTGDLAEAGEMISIEEWMDSDPRENFEPEAFAILPPLPEAFVYTGAAVLGDVLVAAWEEQQEAGIGAAGFMVLSFSVLRN